VGTVNEYGTGSSRMQAEAHIPTDRFYSETGLAATLAGLVEPEAKRRAIGDTFIAVFEREVRRLGIDRCLLAQGYTIYGNQDIGIELDNGRRLMVRQLGSQQQVRLRENSDEVAVVDSLIYYFFVGQERVTNDHYERTFIDMKDRLLKGRDQRWAYVTVAAHQGTLPWSGRTISREEAAEMLTGFCKLLAPEVIDWARVK